jgi:hypothetical protein
MVAGFYVQPSISTLGMTVGWNQVVAVAALAGGVALDSLAPDVAPNVADGLVAGGATITASWLTAELLKAAGVPFRSLPSPLPAVSGARASLGGVAFVPKRELV